MLGLMMLQGGAGCLAPHRPAEHAAAIGLLER